MTSVDDMKSLFIAIYVIFIELIVIYTHSFHLHWIHVLT